MTGTVTELRRYPVKSLQGQQQDTLEVTASGVRGDRAWGLLDVATGRLATAKRFSRLLDASGEDDAVVLPDGTQVALDDSGADAALSAWLGREVQVVRAGVDAPGELSYQMTFDPPNDDAELFDIPVPAGTLLDLAAVHLMSRLTLEHCAATHPELDWDVRRFRPNVVADLGDVAPFEEDGWGGRRIRVGGATLEVIGPTVRCAMPLRAQPGGLDRQPGLTAAMTGLNAAFPNHLGLYLSVVSPGQVRVGDPVEPL